MDAPEVDKHHGLHHGVDRAQVLGKPLDQPGEHVVWDFIAASDGVYSLLDEGAGYFFDRSPSSSGRGPVGDETGEKRVKFHVQMGSEYASIRTYPFSQDGQALTMKREVIRSVVYAMQWSMYSSFLA